MRSKWDKANGGLSIHTNKGWVYVGWVQELNYGGGFQVLCCWLDTPDYPEAKVFETEKQARRALKAAASVAIIGGFQGYGT